MPIRKAVIEDVKAIHKILNRFAEQGLLLPRSLSEIYDHLRDYTVLGESGPESAVVGVCGLGICWEDLAELKSLAVAENLQGKGFGSELILACLEEARTLKLKRVFTLTYIPEFFAKFGFREVEKSALPHKIWGDCLKCPKFPDCDEVAMIVGL